MYSNSGRCLLVCCIDVVSCLHVLTDKFYLLLGGTVTKSALFSLKIKTAKKKQTKNQHIWVGKNLEEEFQCSR